MYYVLTEERQGNRIVREFVSDIFEELKDIEEANFGDIAIVMSPPSVYLKNSHNDWVLL